MGKIKLIQFGFEMTRRCNMRCEFCSRGDSQDIDITKEVINKTLDEISEFDINILRLHGGEPFLVPEAIEFLVEKIIERNIRILQCVVFSNGTIKSPKIKSTLEKLGKYCLYNRKTDWGKKLQNYRRERFEDTYNEINSPCAIILSEYEHDLAEYENFISFYNANEYLTVFRQTENHISGFKGVCLEGRAMKNYQYYAKSGYDLCLYENLFCIINDSYDKSTIDKGISVSANGNIFVGCNQSYNGLDKENICNILYCHNDLFDKIEQWCWKYPLHKNQQNKRVAIKSYMWKYEHGLEPDGMAYYNLCKEIYSQYIKMEKLIKKYHDMYPAMSHFETQVVALYDTAKQLPIDIRQLIMDELSIYEDNDNDFSDDNCDVMIYVIKDRCKKNLIKETLPL